MSVYLHSFRFIWRVPFWQEYHHNLIAEIVQHRSGLLCRWPFWPEGLYNQPLQFLTVALLLYIVVQCRF